MEHLSEGSTETILGVRKIACSGKLWQMSRDHIRRQHRALPFKLAILAFSGWAAGCFFGRGWILKECSRETDLSPGASSSTLACPSGQSKLLLEKRNKAVSCISSPSSPCCSWEALRSCSADTLHKRIHPDPLHKALPPKNLKLLHIFGPHTRTVVIFYGQFN